MTCFIIVGKRLVSVNVFLVFDFLIIVSDNVFVDKPSWGRFIWFGVIPVAVFLGFRVVVIANIKVRDIFTINGYMLSWGLFANVRLAVVVGTVIIRVSP